MRLIDADVFKTEYENLITWVSHRAEKTRLREFINDIQDQPTVKAIPVEWIKEWANKNCIEYLDYDGYPTSVAAYDSWYDIANMIEDWEKENETN